MPYTRPYAGGFVDYPSTTTPINSTALNTMDVGIKTANDQFQSVTTAQRTALSPTVGQCVWDSDLKQLMVFMNASGGNAWQPIGNRIVCTSTTRPSSPFHGQVVYETDTKKELTYNGSAWVQTNSSATTSGVTGVSNLIVPPACQINRATDLSYTSASDISWTTTAAYDTDGMFSSGSPTRITMNTAGIYVINFQVYATYTGTLTALEPSILKNGTTYIALQQFTMSRSTDLSFNMSVVGNFAAAEWVTARFTFSGATAMTVKSSTVQSAFSATWVGRTS